MSAPAPPRRFFAPMFGLVLLFAALGPAVGGAVFVPAAMFALAQSQTAMHFGWIAGLIAHAVILIPAYVVGVVPAAFAGLAYALYDAWAPAAFPRALSAAAIGAGFAQGLYLWLLWAGGQLGVWIEADFGRGMSGAVADCTTGEFDASLQHALMASGAAAGFVCAACAGLIGLAAGPVDAERA